MIDGNRHATCQLQVMLYQPDVGYWLFVIMLLSLVEGVTQAVLALLALRKTRTDAGREASTPRMVGADELVAGRQND